MLAYPCNEANEKKKKIDNITKIRAELRSPKCAANTGVGVDMSPHCFIKCPNGLASYTASGSKV